MATDMDPEKDDPFNESRDDSPSTSTNTEPLGSSPADNGVQYRTLTWWQGGFLITAETVSLGVLGLPAVLASLGLVPGIILIVGLGILTTYTGYIFGQFKLAHPGVHSAADVGGVLFGPVGAWILEVFQSIYLVFIAGSHLLTFTIALAAVSDDATCNIVWSVVGLVVFFAASLPRTLRGISWLAGAAFVSLLSAVLIVIIALGVDVPGPSPTVQATVQGVAFAEAFGSTATIIFAYAGHVTFFSIISEFRSPRDFPKSLLLLQTAAITIYTTAAVAIYVFAGSSVPSPALGAAPSIPARTAYGIALVTIVAAGVVPAHVAAKNLFVRAFRTRPAILHGRSARAWGIWAAFVAVVWLVAWVIAESIPSFMDLLSLISSLFGSWFSYGLAGILWLYLNYDGLRLRGAIRTAAAKAGEASAGDARAARSRSTAGRGVAWIVRKRLLTLLNVLVIAVGLGIMGMGLYASGTEIHDDGGSGSWSCSSSSS